MELDSYAITLADLKQKFRPYEYQSSITFQAPVDSCLAPLSWDSKTLESVMQKDGLKRILYVSTQIPAPNHRSQKKSIESDSDDDSDDNDQDVQFSVLEASSDQKQIISLTMKCTIPLTKVRREILNTCKTNFVFLTCEGQEIQKIEERTFTLRRCLQSAAKVSRKVVIKFVEA